MSCYGTLRSPLNCKSSFLFLLSTCAEARAHTARKQILLKRLRPARVSNLNWQRFPRSARHGRRGRGACGDSGLPFVERSTRGWLEAGCWLLFAAISLTSLSPGSRAQYHVTVPPSLPLVTGRHASRMQCARPPALLTVKAISQQFGQCSRSTPRWHQIPSRVLPPWAMDQRLLTLRALTGNASLAGGANHTHGQDRPLLPPIWMCGR